MPLEIERKFLLKNDDWKTQAHDRQPYCQGYLLSDGKRTLRIRTAGEKGFITIKGKAKGLARPEFEYEIPLEEARELLKLCDPPLIVKTRFFVQHAEHLWEIDVFEGDNAGLIVAEIELQEEEEIFARPAWLGEEVTDDRRYSNASLSRNPWKIWGERS